MFAGRIAVRPARARVHGALLAIAGESSLVRESTRAIARRAGCSHPTVRDALLDLACRGAIEIVSPGKAGARKEPGVYRINA